MAHLQTARSGQARKAARKYVLRHPTAEGYCLLKKCGCRSSPNDPIKITYDMQNK
jgi:hypothetical protein